MAAIVFSFPSLGVFCALACTAVCNQLRAMSAEAREYFQAIKDEFGDDYLQPTDASSLSKVRIAVPPSLLARLGRS